MTTEGIVFFSGMALFIALVYGFSIVAAHRQRQYMASVRAGLGGDATPEFRKGKLIAVSLPVKSRLRFSIHRENHDTREMRQRGEMREIQTGVHYFDQRYFLECDDPRLAQWLAQDETARKRVEQLIDHHGTQIELTGKRLRLHYPRTQDDMALLRLAVDALAALLMRLPTITDVHPAAAEQDRIVRRVTLLISAATVTAIAAGVYVFIIDRLESPFPQHANPWPVLLIGALFGCLFALPPVLWAKRQLQGSSRARTVRASLLAGLYIPIAALTAMGAQQLNLKVVGSGPHVEEATVGATYSRRTRRSHSYYFTLGTLGGGAIQAQAWDSTRAYNSRLRSGTRVRVEWRYGLLGQALIVREPEIIAAAEQAGR